MNLRETLQGCRVAVIGDVMLDKYIWGDVHRISPEAPVPIVSIGGRSMVLGGAANVAANLAGLGVDARLLGIAGGDDAGRQLRETLGKSSIQDHLVTDKSRPTTVKTRIVAGSQQLLRVDEEEKAPIAEFLAEKLLRELSSLLAGCDAVILSDYGKGVLVEPLCRDAIAMCRKREIPVFVDPKGRQWEKYRAATCITPNLKEFHEFIGASPSGDAELAARAEEVRAALGLEKIAVTMGARGVLLVEGAGRGTAIPAQAKEVFDVSGAGDTFIASLSAFVAAGQAWPRAAMLANAAAGIVVGKIGTCAVHVEEMEPLDQWDAVRNASRLLAGTPE